MKSADQVETRDLPPLTLRAAFVPSTVNADKRTVDVVWSRGAKALMAAWDGKYYEALALDQKSVRLGRLNNGAPLLDGHPTGMGDPRAINVRGVVVPGTAKVDGKQGTATVRFAKAEDDPAADQLYRKVADGIVQKVSIGYRVFTYQKSTETDSKIPTLTAIDWEPFEISTVAVGEDDGAGFRAAAYRAKDGDVNPCHIITGGHAVALSDADRSRWLRLELARY